MRFASPLWMGLLLGLLLAPRPAGAEPPAILRPVADDTVVSRDTRLEAGLWHIADENGNGVLLIETDGVTLDLGRAALVGAPDGTAPDALRGVGIVVRGAQGVTIQGGSIRGFKIGVRAENAPGLVIRDVDASENFRQRLASTPEREAPGDWLWPHANDDGEWEARYGAGFSLTDCERARIERCTVRDGQNGLLLTRCTRCEVQGNDFSFNSGWGIALYRSRRCTVAGNRCDWCVRGYSHGVYHRGQDSAGILVFEQSVDNVFVGNSATHGGDGFFLYAGHETTQRTGQGGSSQNLVFDNDFSHAVANGIEATFSEDNVFVRNDCSDCDHGVWAGYSARTLIAGNRIDDCRTAGISIEHGQENRLVANTIHGGPVGIHLWWDPDEDFVQGVFGRSRDTDSARNVIQGNRIRVGDVAVRLAGDRGAALSWNELRAGRILLDLDAGTEPGPMHHNQFQGARRATAASPLAVRNATGTPWVPPEDNQRRGHLRGEGAWDPMTWPSSPAFLHPRLTLPDTPSIHGLRVVRLPAAMPRGREQIRIGPWGPLDPRRPHAVPGEQTAPGSTATVHLLGTGMFRVKDIEGAVTVRPREGALPAALRVSATVQEATTPGRLVPFRLELEAAGERLAAQGTLLDTWWTVRWQPWAVDPREDEAAFQHLWDVEPLRTEIVRALDFPWRDGAPSGVRADRFATLARTVLDLPAGRYRIRTVSDDGIRVLVDGLRVIDNWSHHGPTEDVAELDLSADLHVLQVEHFELDGWAHLALRMERIAQ